MMYKSFFWASPVLSAAILQGWEKEKHFWRLLNIGSEQQLIYENSSFYYVPLVRMKANAASWQESFVDLVTLKVDLGLPKTILLIFSQLR